MHLISNAGSILHACVSVWVCDCVCVSSVMPVRAVCASSLKTFMARRAEGGQNGPERTTLTHTDTLPPNLCPLIPLQTLVHTLCRSIVPLFIPPKLPHAQSQAVYSLFLLLFLSLCLPQAPYTYIATHTRTCTHLEWWRRWAVKVINSRSRCRDLTYTIQEQYTFVTSGGHCDSTYKQQPHWSTHTLCLL